MKLHKLDTLVLRVTKPEKLLKNITSNTLNSHKNALLDRFGKIVVTFYQINTDDGFFILIQPEFYDRLKEELSKFLKLTKAKVEKTDYYAYFDLTNKYEAEFSIPENKGKIIITKNELESNVSQKEFTLFRVKNNIPIQGKDYDREMLLNVSEDYVSYEKGCFIGQEIISRVHHKAKPPKKLIVKKGNDVTSKVKDETGKTIGFTFVKNP